jgi:signal transduction histidine kinase
MGVFSNGERSLVEIADADRLRQLQHVTDAALSHLDLDELLGELLLRIRALLGTDTSAVLLLDREREELVARAAAGLEEEVEAGTRIPLGRGFAGRVAAERRPIVLDDVDHADVLNPILREKGIKSMLGVPLVVGGEAIGVLHVGTLAPRLFDANDVALLQVVADRAALAIEHARLYAAERQARIRLEHVQAVTDAALAHLELGPLLDELLTRIRSILGTDTSAVLLLDRESSELVARAAKGLEEEVEAGIRIPLGRGFAGRVAAERRPIVLDDVESADVLNPILREKGVKSMLGVPLVVGGEAIGVLHVGTLAPRLFDANDVALLQVVAERVALAVERAQLHETALQLDELRLNFVAIASHELRTPAATVYGIAETIRRGVPMAPGVREQLEEALWEQADRLRRLIEQLLDLSRLDARALRLEPAEVAVRALVESAVSAVGRDVLHDVDLRIDPELVVRVDVLVMERVLTNLLANAARYGRPPVTVSATAEEGQVRITVEDAGPGIPADLVPRLFDRFARGLDARGTGLGLAIARAYAQAHGGDVVYEPGAGGGARFEISIPAEPEGALSPRSTGTTG